MTQQQLELKVADLEREVAELRREIKPLRPLHSVSDAFGMFADDPDFEDVVLLGHEYLDQANCDQPRHRGPLMLVLDTDNSRRLAAGSNAK